MKFGFLILVCYAVKCEDIGNNYFVVKMPEDNLHQQDIKDFKKPFHVYWNVPTKQCATRKIPFQNLFEKFGIIQNDNDRFIGNKIVLIYDEKDFPAIQKNKTTGDNILINGGVPQEGNLEKHLLAFENDLNDKIPDPYFDGIAIIDFESWRPEFSQNFGALKPHKHLSIEVEKNLHNWWPKMWIEKEASLRFEAAARRFMQTTLYMAKEKRPNALWGYYGFPYCFNMRGRDMVEKCMNNVDKENDSIYWLWAESTALFPSLYSSVSLTSSQLSSLIKGRVKEASRVRGRDTPILPYFWYRYRDAGFMTEKDLEVALTTLYQSNASGFIIWGSSNDVNTVDKCNKLFKYVETVLGPKIAKYTKKNKRVHNDNLENKEIYSKETSTVYNGISYSRSTPNSNTEKMFSTETSTDYNKYTKTDESSQTLSKEEISSTESTITYNDYTNSDDLQTLYNFDLTLSLLGSSTNSEDTNINLSIPTQNNDEIFTTESAIANDKQTYIDINSQSLNNDEIFSFSSETSTAYNEYTNTDKTPQILTNDETSLVKLSTENYVYTINKDNVISSSESSTDYENSDYSTTTLYNDEIYLAKMTTFDNSHRDEQSHTLYYEENTNIYNEYSDIEQNVLSLNNGDIISLSEPLIIYDENSDHSTKKLSNDDYFLEKITTIDNSNSERSQSLNYDMSNKVTKLVNNKYSDTEENVQTLNNDNTISSTESLTFDYENSNYNITNLNNDEMYSTDTLILYSKFINTGQNNKEILSKGTSTIYGDSVSEDLSTDSLKNEKYIEKTSPASDIRNYTDKITHILNNGEILTEKNEFKSTGNVIINNNALLNSNKDRFDYLIEVANSKNIETFKQVEYKDSENVDDDYLIIIQNLKNKQNAKENITDSKLETVYDTTQAYNNHETESKNENFREKTNDLVVTYIIKKHEIEKNEVSTTTKVESFHDTTFLNSADDRSDYLIKVDKSTNIETYNQSEHTNITNADDDYLVIVTDFNNKKYENNLNLESTILTESDFVSVTNIDDYGVEDLDPVLANINKTIDNMKFQKSIPTQDEYLNNIKLLNSEEDASDYLIRPANFTKETGGNFTKETAKQYEYTESTIADNDYIIIIKNVDD